MYSRHPCLCPPAVRQSHGAGAERKVTVQLPRGSRKHLFLSVDGGKAVRLSGGDRVEISRSEHTTKLVRLSERSFYQIIRQKLGGFAP